MSEWLSGTSPATRAQKQEGKTKKSVQRALLFQLSSDANLRDFYFFSGAHWRGGVFGTCFRKYSTYWLLHSKCTRADFWGFASGQCFPQMNKNDFFFICVRTCAFHTTLSTVICTPATFSSMPTRTRAARSGNNKEQNGAPERRDQLTNQPVFWRYLWKINHEMYFNLANSPLFYYTTWETWWGWVSSTLVSL